MKRVFGLALFIFFALALSFAKDNSLEDSISDLVYKLQPVITVKESKPSIAIMDFIYEKGDSKFDKYFNSVVYEKFFSQGLFKLIERKNIDKILNEQKFQMSGYVDDVSAKSIGKIVGVDYICYGNIIDFGETIRISGKIVNVETGEIVSVANVSVLKTDDINKIFNQTYSSNSLVKNVQTNQSIENKIYWKSTVLRNDFDGYTSYLFRLDGAPGYFIIVLCRKYDDPSKSVVYAGINWADYWNQSEYEIKTDNGVVQSMKFEEWYTNTEFSTLLKYRGTLKSRDFVSLILNNNKFSVRGPTINGGLIVQSFSTYGLSKVISDTGLTYKDIDNAMENNEF